MKQKKLFIGLLVAIFAFVRANAVLAQEQDVFYGFFKELYPKISSQIKPASFLAHGPVEIKFSENTFIFLKNELGLSEEESVTILKHVIADSIISYGSAYLRQNSKLNIADYRKVVLEALKKLKLTPYAHVSDKEAQILIELMKVEYLLLGEIEEQNGIFIIKFGTGNGNKSVESDPIDREGLLRLVKRAIENDEKKKPEPKPPIPPQPKPEPEPEVKRPVPTIPEDRLLLRKDDLREASMICSLKNNRYIVIYPPVYGQLASLFPAFVVFDESKVLNVTTRGHLDVINGVLLSADGKEFYTYSDDGLIIAYSTNNFNELFRLNNDFRSIKNAVLTSNYIITNPGQNNSLTFNLSTRDKVNKAPAGNVITKTVDENLIIKNGIAYVYKDGTNLLIEAALYEDDSCALLINNGQLFTGTGLVERHLDVMEYGKIRRYEPSKDRKMRR